jgi:hypothetical protein
LPRWALEESLTLKRFGEADECISSRAGLDLRCSDSLIEKIPVKSSRHGDEILLSHRRGEDGDGDEILSHRRGEDGDGYILIGALDIQS